MPMLRVVEKGAERSVAFTDSIVIGRDLGNGLVIHDPMSSRRHCQLKCVGQKYFLEDLKSSNGTLLNGRRATEIELEEGDLIEVGYIEGAVTDDTGANGAAMVTEAKFGFSCRDGDLAASLLKAPKSPDPEADMGRHVVRLALGKHRPETNQTHQ